MSDNENLRRSRAVTWCFALFLAIQIVVPLHRLAQPRTQPFGWQMFSSIAGHRFELESPDGSSRQIDPEDFVLHYRAEIDYRDHLPQLLCEQFPDASAVVATNGLEKSKDTYPCER